MRARLLMASKWMWFLALLLTTAAWGQWTEPVPMTPQLGTAVRGPWISNDGLRLYAAGGGYIYVITRDSVNGPWHQWESVGNPINSGMRQESPCESPSGDTLYFMSWERPEGSYGGYDIYYSVRRDTGWGPVMNCGPNINTDADEWSVGISRDGSLLLVSSNHMPVSGWYDLFYSERQTDGSWGPLINFGPAVNSVDGDQHASMPTGNNLIYYYIVGFHMGDIWVSARMDGVWQPRGNLPAPVNTVMGREFDPCISSDGRTLWFTRQDENYDNALYYSFRTDTNAVGEPRQGSLSPALRLGVRVSGEELTLALPGYHNAAGKSVRVYDVLGREAFSGWVRLAPAESGAQGTVHIGALSAGTYFVRLNPPPNILPARFVIH